MAIPIFCLPWTAGAISSVAATSFKSTIDIVATTLQGDVENWVDPFSYFFVLLTPTCLISETMIYNKALQRFEMAKVAPIFKGSVIINNILMGGVLWLEFKNSSYRDIGLYSAGILLCIIGIFMILSKAKEEGEAVPR
jgi:uncharacterized membrane protein